MPKKKLTIQEATTLANDYATDVLSKTPFPLPADMEPEDFDKIMTAILGAIVTAWGAGFLTGQK